MINIKIFKKILVIIIVTLFCLQNNVTYAGSDYDGAASWNSTGVGDAYERTHYGPYDEIYYDEIAAIPGVGECNWPTQPLPEQYWYGCIEPHNYGGYRYIVLRKNCSSNIGTTYGNLRRFDVECDMNWKC